MEVLRPAIGVTAWYHLVWHSICVPACPRLRRSQVLERDELISVLMSRMSVKVLSSAPSRTRIPKSGRHRSGSSMFVNTKAGPTPSTPSMPSQVISIAFRIWLIRNVDLVKATFECKFRVFLDTRQQPERFMLHRLLGISCPGSGNLLRNGWTKTQ